MGLDLLVDTNVFSYMFNGHTLGPVYEERTAGLVLGMSFMTRGELLAGARQKNWGDKKLGELEFVLAGYEVLESNKAVANNYAVVMTFLQRAGRKSSVSDGWIAATALAYRVPLVSHNRRHFEHIPGLELVSFAP